MPLRWFHFLLYYLSRHLTFQHMYFTLYGWKPSTRGQALNTSATDVHAEVNYLDVNTSMSSSTNAQWKSTISKMTDVWTVVVLGSTLLLPSVLINWSFTIMSSLTHLSMRCRTTVALFLHPDIFNRIYFRIIVVGAFLLFGESGTEALILLAHKKRLRSAVKKEAWVDATKYPKTFSSINFWTCLASPLTSLIGWVIRTPFKIGHPEIERLTYRAVGLCLVAVLSLAWQTPVAPNTMSKVDVVLVGGITLLTAMIVLNRIYRVFSLVRY